MKDQEYETLRKEIMHWQARRFSVVTGSLVIVIALLGWAVSAPEKWSWTAVSAMLLGMLTIAGCMTWMIGLLNSSISTYLEVFHEGPSTEIGWERRHRKFKKSFVSSKVAYAMMYLGAGVLSVAVSKAVCRAQSTWSSRIASYVFGVSFLSTLALMIFVARPWKNYVALWKRIRDEEFPDLLFRETQRGKLRRIEFEKSDGPIRIRLRYGQAVVQGSGVLVYEPDRDRMESAEVKIAESKGRKLSEILSTILMIASIVLALGALVLSIWNWHTGIHTPSIVSISAKVFSYALVGSLISLGGVNLFSLKSQLKSVSKPPQDRGIPIITRNETTSFTISDPEFLAELKELHIHNDWTARWIEKCLENAEIRSPLMSKIREFEAAQYEVLRLDPDNTSNGIAITFRLGKRIPARELPSSQ